MNSMRLLRCLALAAAFFIGAETTLAQQTPPPQCMLSANTSVVQLGGTVNLRWQSINASGGTVTSIGNVGPNGIQGVIPTRTTEYVGIFTGPGGSARCSVIITVSFGGTTGGTGETVPPGETIPPGETFDVPGAPALPSVQQAQTPFPQAPAVPSAQSQLQPVGSSQPLVPCGGPGQQACQACHLVELTQRVVNFLILVAVPLAAVLIAVAGAMIFTSGDSAGRRDKAKDILKKALVGFVIVLSSWLVVNTIITTLFDTNKLPGSTWYRIQCVDESTRPANTTVQEWLDAALGRPPEQAARIQSNQSVCGSGYYYDKDNDLCVSNACGSLAGCTDIKSTNQLVNIEAFNCKNPNSCATSPTTNLQLQQMKNALGDKASQYQITETGVNPTVQHASGAANLDMNCNPAPCTGAQVVAAVDAWPGTVKYETNTQADYDAKLSAGVKPSSMLLLTGTFDSSGVCSAGPGKCITAPHMSLNP